MQQLTQASVNRKVPLSCWGLAGVCWQGYGINPVIQALVAEKLKSAVLYIILQLIRSHI